MGLDSLLMRSFRQRFGTVAGTSTLISSNSTLSIPSLLFTLLRFTEVSSPLFILAVKVTVEFSRPVIRVTVEFSLC